MSLITNPRFILLQSETDNNQYFYLVFFDLPINDPGYFEVINAEPKLNSSGTELTYNVDGFTLDTGYNGETATYMLKPFPVYSEDGSVPNIQIVTLKAKNTNKKGDTSGLQPKKVFIDPKSLKFANPAGETNNDYVCAGRCFVIQSNSNTNTYFVGALVDYPANKSVGKNLSLQRSTELQANILDVANPHKTFLIYSQSPAYYVVNGADKTATYTSICVNGYNSDTHKGVLLQESTETDLYATAWPLVESNDPPSTLNV